MRLVMKGPGSSRGVGLERLDPLERIVHELTAVALAVQ